jgi:hypothetical protein
LYIPIDEWLPAFVLTLVVELPIAVLLLRPSGLGVWRLAGIVAIANLATHPVVWFVLPQLLDVGTVAYVAASEAWAVAVEAACYWLTVPGIGLRRAALVSVAANAASWLGGRVVGADLGLLVG